MVVLNHPLTLALSPQAGRGKVADLFCRVVLSGYKTDIQVIICSFSLGALLENLDAQLAT